jgi:co-chaperonin GroES (HSP10)
MSKLKPLKDYVLVDVIQEDTGVVKSNDIRDSLFLGRKGKVLAVGPGIYENGVFVRTTARVGQIVYWEEAAEANTPEELRKLDQALVKEARLIAVEE